MRPSATQTRDVLAAAALAIGLSGEASAQFFIGQDDKSDPIACSSTATFLPGSVSYHLPPSPDNVILNVYFDNVLDQTSLFSISPPDASGAQSVPVNIAYATPHSPPYVMTFEVVPAIGGKAVGLGYRGVATCPASGSPSVVFTTIKVKPTPPAIPALTSAGLAWLGALLALAGAALLRWRRAPR